MFRFRTTVETWKHFPNSSGILCLQTARLFAPEFEYDDDRSLLRGVGASVPNGLVRSQVSLPYCQAMCL